MKDLKSISKERIGRINLSKYKDLVETISSIEYRKISNLGLIDLSEIIGLANYTVYYLVNNNVQRELYNDAYIVKAIKWAIRNEIRRRYKWYVMKNQTKLSQEQVKDTIYKTLLSIEEMAEGEIPVTIKDTSRTPDENAEILDVKQRIQEILANNLSQKERELIEAKYLYDKKLKDLSDEFHISQSRISRIIQSGLNKIQRELLKQERIDENNI